MIDEILSILTDPAHMLAELPYEIAFLLMHAGWVKWKFRKRDVEHGHRRQVDKPAKTVACTGDPCTCTNGIGCTTIPFERW